MTRDDLGRDSARGTDASGAPQREAFDRRSYLKLTGAIAAAAMGTGAGVRTVSALDELDDAELVEIDYSEYDSPSDIYRVWDVRANVSPEFVADPTDSSNTVLKHEFTGNQKTANCCYWFPDQGHGQPSEVYSSFKFHPNGMSIGTNDTVRIYWAGLNTDAGAAGSGLEGPPSGTDGWSIAIGFSDRNNPPAGAYNFFAYTYHMDQGSRSGQFEMTNAPVWMDRWNDIECYVKMNTYSGGSANRDGVARFWINGELAYERQNLRWTTTDSQAIEYFGPLGYTVGRRQNHSMYYDEHEIRIGEARVDDRLDYADDPTVEDPSNASQYDERLTVRNADEEGEYRIYVDGRIVQSDWGQATYNDSVEINDDGEYAVLEAVASPSSVDGYFFDGEIVAIAADPEPAQLWVSGEQIFVDEYPDAPEEADDDGEDDEEIPDEPLENTILIDGVGTTGGTEYEFTVSGAVEASTYLGASINDDDEIDDGTVTGSVTGWRDAFEFSGDLEDLVVDGPARIFVNDERVDPAEYDGDESQQLTIVGNGTASSYEFSVDGSIEGDVDDATIDGGTAEGEIERGVHRFGLSGDLLEFRFTEGGTQAYLGSERLEPDE